MAYLSKTLAGLILATLSTFATAQVVTIATGAQGSLAYSSGQAIAKVANDVGITARTQPLVGYLPLINSGEVDFGFATGVEAAYAYSGTGNYDRKSPNLRQVGMMFSLKTGLMAPCDLGLKTIADVKAKAKTLRIASGYNGSTIIPFYIEGGLANGGLKYDDFKRVPVASLVAGMTALGDNLVDIALVSLNSGGGKEAAVALSARGGLCYISQDPSPAGVAAFRKFLPDGSIVAMPKNENITGLEKGGANIMSLPWVLLTNASVKDDLVYKMIKAIAEKNDVLKASFASFGEVKREELAPANALPYHPGALKYFTEAGIKVQ